MAEEKEVTVKIMTDVDDKSVEDLENRLQQMVDTTINLTSEADTSGTDAMDAGLDEVTESADEATSALESMAMLDIANTLSQWGSQAESFAQELDNIAISTEQLAIQTGMTDAEMTGMLNNITNATFPRDEALMYVQSLDQIGVASENLGASATGLDRINDAFHMGAPAVNKLGQELSVLGVDMNNVSTSFNALAYANANTVGGMENFSKFLTRYDSQFHELGMNVDQAAVAIAAATHKFGGGRAALTGMSTALKNANGDLSVLEQELGLASGSLTNASQLTGQYAGQLDAMADKEAQHKTWTQQLAAALDDVTASTMGALSPFSSFIGMIGNAGSFAVGINGLVQLGNSIRGLDIVSTIVGKLGTLKTAIIDVGTAAVGAIKSIITLGKEILIAGANALKAAAMWVVEKVQLIASTVAKYAAAAASMALGVAEWFAASPILLVAAVILILIGALIYLYYTNEDVRNTINALGESLWGLGEAIVGGIQGAIQWLIDGFTWLGETIMAVFSGTGGEGMNWLSTMMMVFMGPIGWIMLLIQNFNTIAPAVSNALQGMYTNTVNWLNQTGARIHTFASNIVSWLGNAATNAVNAFISPLKGLVDAVASELAAVKATVMSYIQPLIDAFNALGSAAAWAFSVLGLKQGSPGDIYRAMKRELEWTTAFVERDKSGLASATADLGSNVVDSFNPNLNAGGASGSVANAGNTYIFNLYGDMDKEERMKEFLDYVVEYMDWDNNTAGRTV